jgi:hypothetical protein
MTRSASERIGRLMAWCRDNGVQIDPRLGIRPTDQLDGDIAVFSNVNEYIANPVSCESFVVCDWRRFTPS